jgi:hypothetical protein
VTPQLTVIETGAEGAVFDIALRIGLFIFWLLKERNP